VFRDKEKNSDMKTLLKEQREIEERLRISNLSTEWAKRGQQRTENGPYPAGPKIRMTKSASRRLRSSGTPLYEILIKKKSRRGGRRQART